jgi:hypothetical protein
MVRVRSRKKQLCGPMPSSSRRFVVAALLLCSCHGGGAAKGAGGGAPTGLRVPSARTAGGGGDALAAALLLAAGRHVDNGTHPPPLRDPALAGELAFRAVSHLESAALGAGAGLRLDGSARIRALAALPDAPIDRDGNGTNLDETLAEDLAMLAETAGADAAPAGAFPLLFPWHDAVADLAAPGATFARDAFAEQRVAAIERGHVRLEQVGDAMLARVRAAAGLLRTARGSRAGATPEEGLAGLLLLQQVIAAEDTLLGALFHDGRALARLADPAGYRPEDGARWLPAAFAADLDPALTQAPLGYRTHDRASDLAALARMLHAAVELGWLRSAANPHPALRDVVTGHPFGAASPPRRGRKIQPRTLHSGEVTWDDTIGPLLAFRCISCHSGAFAEADFRVSSYQEALRGGRSRATHPTVVPFDHRASLLWQVLVGPTAVARQMPLGSRLPPGEISLVADWIDAGAPESGSNPPPLRRIGIDLAAVLVRNLHALHRDPQTGGLHDRWEGDAPSGFASARATGDALVALAAYSGALPADERVDLAPPLLAGLADFAVQHLTDAQGRSFAHFEFARGLPEGRADLHGHARLLDGLLLAGRVLGDAALLSRGRALGARLLDEFFDPRAELFAVDLERRGRAYTPQLVGDLCTALLRLAAESPDAVRVEAVLAAFLRALLPVLVHAEFARPGGEVIGDGIADSDGNGIAEPALAGGAHGRLPLFVGEIREGPDPQSEPRQAPVLWSTHIQPLLREKCAECHLDGAVRGEYRVDSPALLRTPGESRGALPLIVPGDPLASFFYRKLTDRRPALGAQMPLAQPPLDERGKALVRDWILQGATGR